MLNVSMHKKLLPVMVLGLVAVSFLLIMSFSTSPLFLNEGMDSVVFKTMGRAWLDGRIPYRDIFDHKGPFLYLLNAFGQWMVPGRAGIFMLQCISFWMFLLCMWKTAAIFVGGWRRRLSMCLVLILAGAFFCEGNQCEEWMLPFIAWCLYLLIRDISGGRALSYVECLSVGVSFAAVFLIRPNDAVMLIGGMTLGWFIVKTLYIGDKTFISLLFPLLWMTAGVALITLPFVIYFAAEGAFKDFVYGLIGFNFLYAGGGDDGLSHLEVLWKKIVFFLPFACLLFVLYRTERKGLFGVLLPVVTLLLVLFGSSFFLHYFISLLPMYLVLFAVLLSKGLPRFYFASLCAFFVLASSGFRLGIKMTPNIFKACWQQPRCNVKALMPGGQDVIRNFYGETDKMWTHIPVNQHDSIWNYNLAWEGGSCVERSYFSAFWHAGLLQSNFVTYYRVLKEDPSIRSRNSLQHTRPLWIVLTHASDPEGFFAMDDYKFIEEQYRLIYHTDTTICDIELWRRKDINFEAE